MDSHYYYSFLTTTSSKTTVSTHVSLYAPVLNDLTGDGFIDRFAIFCIDHVNQFNHALADQEARETYDGVLEWLKVLLTHTKGLYMNPWFQDIDCVLSTLVKFPETWYVSYVLLHFRH